VLETGGRIVWMRGVELEPEPGIQVVAMDLEADGNNRLCGGFPP